MPAGIIPGKGQEAESGDDRLLELYWNRAAVKKELAGLRRERYDLLEKLRQQAAEAARVQEQYAALQGLLAHADTAATAIAHFQLRALWQHCATRISEFVGEVADKQMRREQEHLQRDFRQRRARRVAEVGPLLEALQLEVADHEARARALERLLLEMPVWRWRKRRALKQQLAAIVASQRLREAELEELVHTRAGIEAEVEPPYAGLSGESRRLLNLAALALAQELVLFFEEHDLARRARAAMSEDVRNADYGTREEAQRLSRVIDEGMAKLTAHRQLSAAVKRRTDALRTLVEYRRDEDVVPLARSLEHIARDPLSPADGRVQVNVLAEEYWNIHAALR